MADTPNRITQFLTALMTEVQAAEDALQQLYSERRIDTAVGTQLDIIGKIVGQLRNDLDDATYRRYCRARISASRSNGMIVDLIKVASQVLDDDDIYIHLLQEQIATIVVRLEEKAVSQDLGEIVVLFLKDAVSAGVKLILEFSSLAPTSTFSFFDGEGLGFGSTLDASVGGGLASALD